MFSRNPSRHSLYTYSEMKFPLVSLDSFIMFTLWYGIFIISTPCSIHTVRSENIWILKFTLKFQAGDFLSICRKCWTLWITKSWFYILVSTSITYTLATIGHSVDACVSMRVEDIKSMCASMCTKYHVTNIVARGYAINHKIWVWIKNEIQ